MCQTCSQTARCSTLPSGRAGNARDARLVYRTWRAARTVVVEGMTSGHYVAPGYLLYADATGTLLLQPFDWRDGVHRPARAVLQGSTHQRVGRRRTVRAVGDGDVGLHHRKASWKGRC